MADKSTDAKPMFLQGAEILARKRGISIEAFLADYERSIHNSKVPGNDCLDSEEIVMLAAGTGKMSVQSGLHLHECDSCNAAIEAMKNSRTK